MISTEHTQSLTDFRAKATETLDRLNQGDHAEILTVNGQARAVLLSPTAYDQLARDAQLTRDVAVMRQAIKELDEGKGIPLDQAMDRVRNKLLAMQAAQDAKRDAAPGVPA